MKTAKKSTKVVVAANDKGQVVVQSENSPEWGYIRVTQNRMTIDDNGFARRVKLGALIPGKVEDLETFGWVDGEEIPGKIVFREQLTPFNPKNPSDDHKIAGDTEILCVQNGKPIYRKTFYFQDEEAIDTSCEHTNKEEIKAAFAALKAGPAKL